MGVNYNLIVLELKKKLIAAEAERDALSKDNQKNTDVKSKLRQLDEIIDSLKTQISLLQ
jgi:hypothetical protein